MGSGASCVHAPICRSHDLCDCRPGGVASIRACIGHAAARPESSGVTGRRLRSNWSGFYLGGELGFDFATAKYVRPQSSQNDIWIGSANRGLVGGVYAGINYQALPWLVLGLEGDLSSSRANYRELGADVDFLQDSKYLAARSPGASVW